jgi:hypothetical protein
MNTDSDLNKPNQDGAEKPSRVSKADQLDRLIDPKRLDRARSKEAESKPKPKNQTEKENTCGKKPGSGSWRSFWRS